MIWSSGDAGDTYHGVPRSRAEGVVRRCAAFDISLSLIGADAVEHFQMAVADAVGHCFPVKGGSLRGRGKSNKTRERGLRVVQRRGFGTSDHI